MGGGGGGSGGGGFTLGVRSPGQTFSKCMETHASDYSITGLADLATKGAISSNSTVNFAANVFGGNSLTGTYYAFAGTTQGSAYNAVTTGAGFTGNIIAGGMGSTLTYGRRTSAIMSLNLAGKGGLPQALSSSSAGVKGFFGKMGTGALRLAADVGFTLAEGIGCMIPK